MEKEKGCSQDVQREYQDLEIKESLDKINRKILVMSGKGGVGKSTVAVNIASSLANTGKKVGLLDVDLHGPSIPQMLGIPNMNDEAESSRIKNSKKGVKFFNNKIYPAQVSENLFVISIECFLSDNDSAVIWRGPKKISAIRQFISDIYWNSLDYLIIDSPPGTGDEPLTIAQIITDTEAIIVTTPQSVSIRDVRKSINFCREVNMNILGLIENMSGFVCPHCGSKTDIFESGGGVTTAKEMQIEFLGSIPIIPEIVQSSDSGVPGIQKSETVEKIFNDLTKYILKSSNRPSLPLNKSDNNKFNNNVLKIALPVAHDMLAMHFGHCEEFVLIDADTQKCRIIEKKVITAPEHQPGLLPKWLSERGVDIVIAGGMGSRAQSLFSEYDIKVIVGAAQDKPESIVMDYLNNNLILKENICDH
jgi:Mrp family chromosome partitioning ATPase/predicted Fe-Mo cluster-binding NifX family protein